MRLYLHEFQHLVLSAQRQLPSRFWNSMENQKRFMDEIASKLCIKYPSDWGKVTGRRIHELGGNTLLRGYYNGSLFACLQSVYKGKFFFSQLIP